MFDDYIFSPRRPGQRVWLRDYGPYPFVTNIEEMVGRNRFFRVALWTGEHLQLTLMSIEPGDDIGLELHTDLDQFIRIERGQGLVLMGNDSDCLDYRTRVYDGYVIFIPAGTWHNLINIGRTPLKLYSIYAPPAHPHGTVQERKEDAEEYSTEENEPLIDFAEGREYN